MSIKGHWVVTMPLFSPRKYISIVTVCACVTAIGCCRFSLYHFANAWDDGATLKVHVCRHNGPRESLEANFKNMYDANFKVRNKVVESLDSKHIKQAQTVPKTFLQGGQSVRCCGLVPPGRTKSRVKRRNK